MFGAGSGVGDSFYLTSDAVSGQLGIGFVGRKPVSKRRCYHHNRNETALHRPHPGHRSARRGACCRPKGRGRRPGGAECAAVKCVTFARTGDCGSCEQRRERARGRASGGSPAGGVGRGVAGFLRPFQRVGGIIWLEVSGVFFLVFVAAFAPTLWRTRFSYAHGPDHRTFWSAAVIMVVFLYLSVTSFWRARKK